MPAVEAQYFPPGTPLPRYEAQARTGSWTFGSGFGASTMNAAAAVARLQERYAQLSRQAASLIKIAHVVPCRILDLYNRAVADYRRFGRDLFNELDKRGIKVEQIVYKDGQPQRDPANPNNFVSRTISAPLTPPVFTVPVPRCPGLFDVYNPTAYPPQTPFAGRMPAQLGVVPVAMAAYAIGGLILVAAGGYFSVKALEQIKLIINGDDPKPAETVGSYLSCFDKMVASGLAADQAVATCQGLATASPGSLWRTVGIGVSVVAIVGGLVYILFQRYRPQGGSPPAAPELSPAAISGYLGGCAC